MGRSSHSKRPVKSSNLNFFQGPPSQPTDLQFTDITMNSFNVSWSPPKKKNGELVGYVVTYETVEQNDRKIFLKMSRMLSTGFSTLYYL